MRYFKLIIIIFVLVAGLWCVATPQKVLAASNPFSSTELCKIEGANKSAACEKTGDPILGKNGIFFKTSAILAIIGGVAAVIVVIVGGFMYVTAEGDTNKMQSARRAIVGAVVGLAIISSAEAIIALIINLVG